MGETGTETLINIYIPASHKDRAEPSKKLIENIFKVGESHPSLMVIVAGDFNMKPLGYPTRNETLEAKEHQREISKQATIDLGRRDATGLNLLGKLEHLGLRVLNG
ncbi:hypothetical protein NDU88_006150 [Pleurodeles waltl]|uniref:Endonuclease/exonuclease/phosphatase domain-containing protein n=1 Tax=Pleurodeles waltl TaxID=8319 RepID=A0AAV7WDZ4_PLEWA|nr:hypothetical protein NDU88_006150 [Pleurodeles waltl]